MSPLLTSRNLKRFLIGFISLLILVLLALWIIDVTAKRRWTAYVEDLKNRGIPTTYEEVIKTDVPADQNAAVLWEQAVAEPWVVPKEGSVLSQDDHSEPDRAGKLVPKTPESRSAILAELEANNSFIEALRKIAACPCYAYILKSTTVSEDRNDKEAPSSDQSSPTVHQDSPFSIKRFRFLSKAIGTLAYEGETERSLDLLNLGLDSSRHLLESPCKLIGLISGVVKRDYLAVACTELLKKMELTPEQSQTLITRLDPIKMRDGFRQAMNTERCFFVEGYSKIVPCTCESPEGLDGKRGFMSHTLNTVSISVQKISIVNHAITKHEKMLQFCNTLTSPTSVWRAAGKDSGFEIIKGIFIDDLFRVESRCQILRLGIASKAYRNEHGTWPAGLEALVPEYFEVLPLDPLTDHPFVYKPVKESIRISRPIPVDGKEAGDVINTMSWDTEAQVFAPGPS